MILEDSIRIRVRPEALFRFFDEIETHYCRWHPDHVLFRWERGRAQEGGERPLLAAKMRASKLFSWPRFDCRTQLAGQVSTGTSRIT